MWNFILLKKLREMLIFLKVEKELISLILKISLEKVTQLME